jgi:hypothetical protein
MANIESKNLLVAVKAYARANALPLDKDEVWESLEAAQAYVESPTAYAGQTIKVLIGDKYKSYIIQPSNGGLVLEEQTGGSGEGDADSTLAYVQVVEALPEEGQVQGVIYVNVTDNKGYIWTGAAWKEIFSETSMEISGLQEMVEAKANLDGATFTGSVILAGDPTEDLEAVTKQYVDRLVNQLQSEAPGVVDSSNPLPEEHKAGQSWRVAEAGVYAGKACEVGDLIICVADGTTIDENNFIVVQANIDGAVSGPETATDANIVVFDGITGKIIKDSEVSLASLNDAIAKAHTHKNFDILESYTKTETELLEMVVEDIAAASETLQAEIDKKANADNVYSKSEIDTKVSTIEQNLNSKATMAEVNSAIETKLETSEESYHEYVELRLGLEASTSVKDYVDNAIGSGGTDAAEAIAKAKQEAINAAYAYTDSALIITEF